MRCRRHGLCRLQCCLKPGHEAHPSAHHHITAHLSLAGASACFGLSAGFLGSFGQWAGVVTRRSSASRPENYRRCAAEYRQKGSCRSCMLASISASTQLRRYQHQQHHQPTTRSISWRSKVNLQRSKLCKVNLQRSKAVVVCRLQLVRHALLTFMGHGRETTMEP
jgi:hypothetical protein